MIGFYYEQLKKAREVAVALSQNLISFHKGVLRFGADAKNYYNVGYLSVQWLVGSS
jgi:hypothetical protein